MFLLMGRNWSLIIFPRMNFPVNAHIPRNGKRQTKFTRSFISSDPDGETVYVTKTTGQVIFPT